MFQPTLEDHDGREKVVTAEHHQVDVVRVLAAAEAVCQVVLRIHGRTQLTAVRTLKTEVTIALLGDRTVPTEASDS